MLAHLCDPVHNVQLRSLDQADFPFLYELMTRDSAALVGRFRGATPDPRTFSSTLWESGTTEPLSNAPIPLNLTMFDTSGSTMATASALGSDGKSFTSIWSSCS